MDIETINKIYKTKGFQGVINIIPDLLEYGTVTETEKGLWKITTGGWREDEYKLDELNSRLSFFSYKHYIGFLRGGAYYYAEDPKQVDEAKITLKIMEAKNV